MDYNTQRNMLYLPEYGRLVQSLVDYCKTLKTKEERTEAAKTLATFIAQRNPHVHEDDDDKKIWDHLFILANYDLDIDCPYPMPEREEMKKSPKKLQYPSYADEYKFYGKSILQLIARAIDLPEGEEKEALVEVIANNMKKSYNVYNKEHVQDAVIIKHLKALSHDKLNLSGIESLEKSKLYYSTTNHRHKMNRGNNNNNNQQKRRNNYRNNNHHN